jgi:hypothetical protein
MCRIRWINENEGIDLKQRLAVSLVTVDWSIFSTVNSDRIDLAHIAALNAQSQGDLYPHSCTSFVVPFTPPFLIDKCRTTF